MNFFHFYIPEWFFVAFNFLVLVFILTKILWNPVNKMLTKRQEEISKALDDAKIVAAEMLEMDTRRAELEEELSRLTAEQMKEARVRAGKEYDRIVDEAEEKSKAILASARSQAERDRERYLREAEAEMVAAALKVAGVLIGAHMDADANTQLIESALSGKRGRV